MIHSDILYTGKRVDPDSRSLVPFALFGSEISNVYISRRFSEMAGTMGENPIQEDMLFELKNGQSYLAPSNTVVITLPESGPATLEEQLADLWSTLQPN